MWAGNLVLSYPVWSTPRKGDLTLNLALVYTNTNWDNREWGGVDHPEQQPDEPPHKWSRARESWIHPGWTLCLGRIAKAPFFEADFRWHYVDATGGRHLLVIQDSSTPVHVYATDDGSFIKAVNDTTAGTWTAYFPDGQISDFGWRANVANDDADEGGGYYLTTQRDRHGNSYTATYITTNPVPGALDSITDSYGRFIDFTVFGPGDPKSGHLQRIDAPAFNGQTATTTLEYDAVTITEMREDTYYGGTGVTQRQVARLIRLNQPEPGYTTQFGHVSEGSTLLIFTGRPLEVSRVTNALGGVVKYTYNGWEWLTYVQWAPGDIREFPFPGYGVVQVDRYADGNEANTAPENHSRWVYQRNAGSFLTQTAPCLDGLGEGGFGSQWGRVDVDGPDGNTTPYQFGLRRPASVVPLPGTYTLIGKEMVRTVYAGTCHDWSCDGVDACAGREVERTITAYERDGSSIVGSGNHRAAGETTRYLEEPGARTTSSSCSWNGFGAHGKTTTTATGTLSHPAVTSSVTYTPDPVGWILSNWTEATDEQRLLTGSQAQRVTWRARFDTTGRVTAEQGVAALDTSTPTECPLSVSATSPYPPDLPEALRPWPTPGALLAAASYPSYSDWPTISSASAAAQAVPLTFALGDIRTSYLYHTSGDGNGKLAWTTRTRPAGPPADPSMDTFTWKWGAPQTKQRVGVSFLSYDVDVDPNTGRVTRSRDTAGRFTDYMFDRLGRLTRLAPEEDAATDYVYETPTRLRITVSAADGASSDYHLYDGMGREVMHERTQVGSTLAYRQFAHDASSRRVKVGRWNDAGTATPWVTPTPGTPPTWIDTSYSVSWPGIGTIQDPRGRVRKVTHAVGNEVTYTYPFADATRASRAGLNNDPLQVVSSLAVKNGLGQLVSVTPDQPGGASATYLFDIFGEMSQANVVGQASGTTFTQVRTWTRNGLGQLVASTDPESGLTEILEHDVDGNVLRSRDANGAAQGYTLVRTYDAAGRSLTLSKDVGGTLTQLAAWQYDGVGSTWPGTHDLGKLTREIVPLPDFGGTYWRSIRYSGRGGRPDRTRVDLTLTGMGTTYFEGVVGYTDRGLLEGANYPNLPIIGTGGVIAGYLYKPAMLHVYSKGYATETRFQDTLLPQTATVSARAPNGAAIDLHFGNGTRRATSLDSRERISRITVSAIEGGTIWDSGTYEYDGLNNIIAIGRNGVVGTHPQTFRYDVQGRLVLADLPGSVITYAFDGFGNMTDRVGAPWPSTSEGGFGGRVHFVGMTHDNRIHDPGFAFDPSGNLTASPNPARAYMWDEQSRLRQVTASGATLTKHAYDTAGERLLKQEGTETRFYYRGGGAATMAEYVWQAGLGWRLDRQYMLGTHGEYGHVLEGAPQVVTWYGTDHLASPRALTNASGELAEGLHLYEPFGLEVPPLPTSMSRHTFTGHERDVATDLDYMHARFYGAREARFASADPITGTRAASWQAAGWNRYAYAGANPVGSADPDGRSAVGKIVGWIMELAARGQRRVAASSSRDVLLAAQQAGEDIRMASRSEARDLATRAGGGRPPIHDKATKPGHNPHYHPADRSGGHILYSVAAVVTLSHHARGQGKVLEWLAFVGDLINPLTFAQDAADIGDALSDAVGPMVEDAVAGGNEDDNSEDEDERCETLRCQYLRDMREARAAEAKHQRILAQHGGGECEAVGPVIGFAPQLPTRPGRSLRGSRVLPSR